LLTKTEAARRLGVSIDTLTVWIADGRIYAVPVGVSGKHVRVPVAEIEKYRSGRYGDGAYPPLHG
jgi:excisionase family DNA binding protein